MKKYLKNWWIVLGIIIGIWNIFWFVNVRVMGNYEFIINVVLLTIGYCLLINYFLITIVFIMIKRLKKEWKIKE